MEDVELDIREDALSEIAKKAIEVKTGARGLRSILRKHIDGDYVQSSFRRITE